MRTLSRVLVATTASVAATQVKTWAEAVLQPVAEQAFPPASGEKTELGADPADHPENMPPAELADRVGRAAGADPMSDDARTTSSQVLHWATGIGAGLTYALLARRLPALARGRGLVFGTVLFAATHGSLLPALRLQDPFSELPTAWWVWEPGSHLVYGVALDTALRLGESALEARA